MKRRAKRKPTLTDKERMAIWQFREAAMRSWCAMCGGHHLHRDAHHVVDQAALKRRGRRKHLWDPRNAMALCRDCHERHTNASRRVPYDRLSDQNLEFAREVLGPYAEDWLARRYPKEAA